MSVELSKMASQLAEAAEKASEQQSATANQTPDSGVQDQDASKFREAMNQQPHMAEQAQQNQPAHQVNQAASSEKVKPASMGDAILDKLQQVSQQNVESMKSIEEITKSDDSISISSMMEVQTELMKMQLTEEVGSKAEGKVDQTLETLLKS